MPERLTLLDFRRKSEVVDIGGGQEVEVFGITFEVIADLLRFTALQKWLQGLQLTPEDIAADAPEAIRILIARGCGYVDSKEVVEAAKRAGELTIEQQFGLLEAISRVTFSQGGFGPFVRRLQGAAEAVSVEAGKARATSSPRPSSPPPRPAPPSAGTRGNAPHAKSPPSASSIPETASAT